MTVTTVEIAPGAVSRQLRIQVREHFEDEYLRLRAVDRPALLLASLEADDDGTDVVAVERALAISDYQIAAIHDYLGTVHDPRPHDLVCLDCCVLLDRGDGPDWSLVAALPETDLPVIAVDSALGRALIGARPGQVVEYPTPVGPRTARVLALA